MAGENFGEVARMYDAYRPHFREGLHAQAIDELVEQARFSEGDTIVEIGTGTGLGTEALLARGLNVVGVEPDSRMLAVAHERLEDHVVHTDADFGRQTACGVPSVRFVNSRFGDAVESGKLQGVYDGVAAITAIHWAIQEKGLERAAKMIASLLKPCGRLALIHTPISVYSPQTVEFSRASQALWPPEFMANVPNRKALVFRSVDDIPLRDFSPYLKPVSRKSWTIEQELSVDTHQKLMQTYWEMLALAPDVRERFLTALRKLSIEEFNSKVPVSHAILLQIEEVASV